MSFGISPGVYPREIDLSTIIPNVATSVGGVVGYSVKGPTDRTLVTSTKEFIDLYGEPVPGNYLHYTALAFLAQSKRLYVKRVHNGALFSGLPLYDNAHSEVIGTGDGSTLSGFGITTALAPTANSIVIKKAGTQIGTDDGAGLITGTGIDGASSTVDYNTGVVVLVFTAAPGSGESITIEYTPSAAHIPWTTGQSTPSSYVFGTAAILLITAQNPGVWGDKIGVEIKELDATNSEFRVVVSRQLDDGTVVAVEGHDKVVSRIANKKDGNGDSMYIGDVFENSTYIAVVDNTAVAETAIPKTTGGSIIYLGGGSDGSTHSDSDIITGWNDFSNVDEVAVNILMAAGETNESVSQAIDTICSARRDCVGILDAPDNNTVSQLTTFRTDTLLLNSNYSAIYSPWLKTKDEYNDKIVYVPPSGYIGASLAFTDENREAWFSNAGLNRGVLNVLGLRDIYDEGERDSLSEKQVNYVRWHPSGSIVIWEDQTLQTKPSALGLLPIRRLLIVLQKAISIALDYYLFEPNDFSTRVQITSIINDYMEDIQARRGVTDFRVVCDETNNTAVRQDRNELWVDVYIKPTRPAKFIRLQMIITRSGASFDELIETGV